MQINILHVSDLHIAITPIRREILSLAALSEVETYERIWKNKTAASFNPIVLDAVSDFVNKQKKAIDAILITGDIATTGNIDDLQEAHDIITGNGIDHGFGKLTKLRHPVFDFPPDIPIFLLPGNHDRYKTDGKLYSPGSKNFHNVFNAFWRDDVEVGTLNKEDISVGLILADFSLNKANDSQINYDLLRQLNDYFNLSTPLQVLASLAQGKVYNSVLYKLIAKTQKFIDEAAHQNKEPFIIWGLHYPPRFYKGSNITKKIKSEYKKLIDEDNLLSAAEILGVNVILAGHTHEHKFYKINEIDVNCAGSATQFMIDEGEIINNYCHILTLDISGENFDLVVSDYKYDKSRRITAGEFKRVK